MSALEPSEHPDRFRALAAGGKPYRKCQNYALENVCNWMVPVDDASPFCTACALNQTIPSLDAPENRIRWASIEASKRRLVYSLLELGLPVESKTDHPTKGLAFAFLANPEPAKGGATHPKVMTGHNQGLITINVAEADEVERELTRRQVHEVYRTLVGHFRHESGHYYWQRLVDQTPALARFRELFGDERADYATALERHYAEGAPADWTSRFISSYASSHPWEDWAETWAHYLHITDTLDTAGAFGVVPGKEARALIDQHVFGSLDASDANDPFDRWMRRWVWLSLVLNAMNRSMGIRDPYPFVLNRSTTDKLRFVHEVIGARR